MNQMLPQKSWNFFLERKYWKSKSGHEENLIEIHERFNTESNDNVKERESTSQQKEQVKTSKELTKDSKAEIELHLPEDDDFSHK